VKRRSAKRLQSRLLHWYAGAGRAALPWRVERNPYYTLVSEFMLQQTQVERVIPKFEAFVRRFPNVATLADASTADVLRAWKGLGYNSRALRLKQVAQVVMQRHGGRIPRQTSALEKLPGIGPYTAAAIRAFAYNIDDAPIDTNVRRVVGRLFGAPEHDSGVNREIDRTARQIVPTGRAHDWNSALMDLGSTICTARAPKCLLCPLRSDCVAPPFGPSRVGAERRRSGAQSRYESTARYARGRLIDRLRDLPAGQRISLLDLHRELEPMLAGRTLQDVRAFVLALEKDGLVACDDEYVGLPE
jgi:A/G-specific adenine glycosylase